MSRTRPDKRYVRRDSKGQFKESDYVGRSFAADRRKKAKTVVKPGQGDKGTAGSLADPTGSYPAAPFGSAT